MTDAKLYEMELRKIILNKLQDLKDKIENNEPCPESEQDTDLLVEIDDRLEECLDYWNY